MSLWELEPDVSGGFAIRLRDTGLERSMGGKGFDTGHVRSVFKTLNVEMIEIDLVDRRSGLALRERQEHLPDVMYGTWPIMSQKAQALAIELGCDRDEFWPCQILAQRQHECSMHVPSTPVDIVDIGHSTFRIRLPNPTPGGPELLAGIERLVPKQIEGKLKGCFRAAMPGHKQTFSELIATQDFKLEWERRSLTGGNFRPLMLLH